MSVEITTDAVGPIAQHRDVFKAMRTGWRQQCPACGRGRLYERYLKTVDTCSTCATDLHHHRADDAPPYFTMMVVGHVLVGGALWLEQAASPSLWLHFVIWMPLTIVLSLWLLPRIKGSLVGLQWACRMHGFGSGKDPAAPDEIGPITEAAGGAGRRQ